MMKCVERVQNRYFIQWHSYCVCSLICGSMDIEFMKRVENYNFGDSFKLDCKIINHYFLDWDLYMVLVFPLNSID